ncbi:MAG: ABC transporter permease [Lachnospiraceae bacterium]|jgi:ribose/xylose/arabinose/galactoside ABC-type transport system permease subunit|nr:ABC transporter permease [Lachnospiraceae bacterium]
MDKPKTLKDRLTSLIFGDYMILLPALILVVIWTVVAPNFMTYSNWMNLLRQVSLIAILAAGMFFPMLTGAIDLGLGSVVGITGIVFAKLLVDYQMNTLLAAILTVLLGAAIGAAAGILITKFGVPSFIATLGVQFIGRGMCYVITNSYPVSGLPDSIAWFGRGYLSVGGTDLIPWPVVFMFIVFAVVAFITTKTKFGRFVYTVGGNEEAAYLSGINSQAIRTSVFAICDGIGALVAVILVSRLNSGQPQGGTGWEFKAVIASVMGGASLSGGKGNAIGVALGAIFVGVLENGMTLLNISSYHQQVVQGVVLILAIMFDVYKNRRLAEAK